MYDKHEKNIRQGLKSPPAGGTRFQGLSRPDRGNIKGVRTPDKSGATSPKAGRSAMTWGGQTTKAKSTTKFGPFKSNVDGEYVKGNKSPSQGSKTPQKP